MPKTDNKTLRDAYEEWRRLNQEVAVHADALAARGVTSSEIEDDIMQRYERSHDWAVALFQPIADALVKPGGFDQTARRILRLNSPNESLVKAHGLALWGG